MVRRIVPDGAVQLSSYLLGLRHESTESTGSNVHCGGVQANGMTKAKHLSRALLLATMLLGASAALLPVVASAQMVGATVHILVAVAA